MPHSCSKLGPYGRLSFLTSALAYSWLGLHQESSHPAPLRSKRHHPPWFLLRRVFCTLSDQKSDAVFTKSDKTNLHWSLWIWSTMYFCRIALPIKLGGCNTHPELQNLSLFHDHCDVLVSNSTQKLSVVVLRVNLLHFLRMPPRPQHPHCHWVPYFNSRRANTQAAPQHTTLSTCANTNKTCQDNPQNVLHRAWVNFGAPEKLSWGCWDNPDAAAPWAFVHGACWELTSRAKLVSDPLVWCSMWGSTAWTSRPGAMTRAWRGQNHKS